MLFTFKTARSTLLQGASAIAIAVAASSSALASDPTPRPFAGSSTWAGLYMGINAGKSMATFTDTYAEPANPAKTSVVTDDINSHAFGGHLGYNFQHGVFVVGGEIDLAVNMAKSGTVPLTASGKKFVSSRVASLSSLRARAGIAMGDLLVYGTAGLAGVRGSTGDGITQTFSDFSKTGFVYGGGAEYKLGKGVVLGAEALVYDVDPSVTGLSRSAKKTTSLGFSDLSVVRARLSFQF